MDKKLGFGFMRLPEKDGEIDTKAVCEMVDTFMQRGFCYFDTARPYCEGKSETAVKECLADRYPRESFILTNKLTTKYFKKEGGIRPLFESQLKACGVEYFDYYLMHSQARDVFNKYKRCRAYETALELKNEGKIKHIGISFHDNAHMLEQILNEYPFIEVVQLQFNYFDFNDPAVQSKACYDVCVKHNKQVFVMEPVRGGRLIDLPEKAMEKCRAMSLSPVELAIRFAASFENVQMVLSGMSNMEQVVENTSFMANFVPLNEKQKEAALEIATILHEQNLIGCTSCRYCTSECPQNIDIPSLFACFNSKKICKDWNAGWYYSFVYTVNNGKASSCLKCGKCEQSCPQHLEIRKLLENVATEFENGEKVK